MALIVTPTDKIGMVMGEEYAYELDLSKELRSKTVASYTYTIYDSDDASVTSVFGGGSVYAARIITFGIKSSIFGKICSKVYSYLCRFTSGWSYTI